MGLAVLVVPDASLLNVINDIADPLHCGVGGGPDPLPEPLPEGDIDSLGATQAVQGRWADDWYFGTAAGMSEAVMLTSSSFCLSHSPIDLDTRHATALRPIWSGRRLSQSRRRLVQVRYMTLRASRAGA
jgi:hypothetical protein